MFGHHVRIVVLALASEFQFALSLPTTCSAGEECSASAEPAVWSLIQSSTRAEPGPKSSELEVGHQKPGLFGDVLASALPKSQPVAVQSNETGLCNQDVFARPELCPAICPYAAEMRSEFCHFRCVQRQECGLLGTVENATIPDDGMKFCRHCDVEACAKCVAAKPGDNSTKLERCVTCMPGYELNEEGECDMKGVSVFIAIGVIGGLATVCVIWWYVAIILKPCVNDEGIQEGLQGRHRMKLFSEDDDEPYPLTTNLMMTNVAGPATMAMFRYEAAVILWAVILLLVWLGFAFFVSSDLLILGTRDASSPQLLCAVVAWGHARQMELIWTKVSWLSFAYVFSFGGAVVYGIQQSKMFVRSNNEQATMPSFALKLTDLPIFGGNDPVEDTISKAVELATKFKPLGVSVAWNYEAHKEEIEHAIESESSEDVAQGAHGPDHGRDSSEDLGAFGKLEKSITDQVLGAWHVHLDDHGHGHSNPQELTAILKELRTTPTAFVVFGDQASREQALQAAQAKGGVLVDGIKCPMETSCYAPEGLLWDNFHVDAQARSWKIALSTLALIASCCVWTFLLYIPYALYMSSFSFANGDEPGKLSEYIFVALVVGSQIGLFVVSSMGAKFAQFHSEDETQKTYTVFYNAALILNLAMDITLQTFLSYQQMVGVGAHVSDGRLLGSLTNFQEIFESYPIQKSVGKLLYVYCWPCTFLVPFMAEPFVAWLLPYFTAQRLVGANRRIRGENAVKAFELGEMEQGRYADIIFNVILVVCIPFISPAYMAWTFGALIVSHVYIYLFDQVKTLRYVVKFNFGGPDVHWLGMQLWAIPCGILASALVFKANQMSADPDKLGSGFLQGKQLWYSLGAAFAGHIIIHLSVLEFVVKPFSLDAGVVDDKSVTYEKAAKSNPATHFSTNPIYCLRSKYILNHSPPQVMYSAGKEHLMKLNPKIGAHFQAKAKEIK